MNKATRVRQCFPVDKEKWQTLYYKNKCERQRRRLHALMVIGEGQNLSQVSTQMGISRTTLSKWLDTYLHGGLEALVAPEHRRVPQKLSPMQLKVLRFIVKHKVPADYGIDSYQWTGKILQQLLETKWGVHLGTSRIYRILDKGGLSLQRSHRDYGPPPPLARQQEFISGLRKSLEECPENGKVLALDEFSLTSGTTTHYVWAEKNSKPKVASNEKCRRRTNGFLAVDVKSGETRVEFRQKSKTADAIVAITLLILAFAQQGCHWFRIILDNATIHREKMREGVQAVLNEIGTHPGFEYLNPVTLSFLLTPPYSPDFNPAEYIIHAVRKNSLYHVPCNVSLEQKAERIKDHLARGSPYTPVQMSNIVRHIYGTPDRKSKRKWPLLE